MPKGFRKNCAPAVSQTVVFEGNVYRRYPEAKTRTSRVYYRSWKEGVKQLLHRAIYESVYGGIPEGFEVHHKDENPLNNPTDGSL